MLAYLCGTRMRSRSAVKRIKSRIEAIGKKKQAVLRLLKNDVADLLAAGRDSDAFGRVCVCMLVFLSWLHIVTFFLF